jgi:PilZ domain-containing protein
MGKLNDSSQPPHALKRRKHRRFSLRYPVHVKFGLANSVSELEAVSNNLSLGGVLLEADSPIPQYCDVSFIMTVKEHPIVGSTQVVGEGKVLRIEPHPSGAGFAIAVKCKRPISQLAGFLHALPQSR